VHFHFRCHNVSFEEVISRSRDTAISTEITSTNYSKQLEYG
jgi:hypothetical protein